MNPTIETLVCENKALKSELSAMKAERDEAIAARDTDDREHAMQEWSKATAELAAVKAERDCLQVAQSKVLNWTNESTIVLDRTIQMGHGYDWDGWELFRQEAQGPRGRVAVWNERSGEKPWSAYDASDGGLAMWQFATEEEAKSAVHDWCFGPAERDALLARNAELEKELESHSFDLSPAMVQARNDQLNAENETLRASLRSAEQAREEAVAELAQRRELDGEAGAIIESTRHELEEARKERDTAQALARWTESLKVIPSVRELATKLPPDILMSPLPFPDRMDYAAKIISEFMRDQLNIALGRLQKNSLTLTPQNDWVTIEQIRQEFRLMTM